MRQLMKAAAMLLVVVMAGGCAMGKTRGWVEASAWGANYTEDFIFDFWIQTNEGEPTEVGGVQLAEFSRGGRTGSICCGLMPGVGQIIKVVWRIGSRHELASDWKTYSRNVVVNGAMPERTSGHSYLVVRFFSGQEVETELFPSEDFSPKNPRVDKLFSGRRVMRQKGE